MEKRIYKVTAEKYKDLKKVLESDPYAPVSFSRQGYKVREGDKVQGGEKGVFYLLIEAEPSFFSWGEPKILPFATRLTGTEFENIKRSIEEEEENAAGGIGAIFG